MLSDIPPHRRLRAACDNCHKLKIRCDGHPFCSNCHDLKEKCCVYSPVGRLGRPPGAKNKRKGHSATCPKAANKSVQSNDIGTLKDMQANTPDVKDQQTTPSESKPLQRQHQEIRPQEQAQEQPRTIPLEHHPASDPLQPTQHGVHLSTVENSTNFVDQPIDWKTRLHPFSHILAGSWDWPQPNAPFQPR